MAGHAKEHRNSSPIKDRPTRRACQIEFSLAGEEMDVTYPVQRIQEGLAALAQDYPEAYDITARMSEVPIDDLDANAPGRGRAKKRSRGG